jgi:hypothetical protein
MQSKIAGPLRPQLHFFWRHYCESRLFELLRKAHRVHRSAGTQRAAMRGNVDAGSEPANDRLAELTR